MVNLIVTPERYVVLQAPLDYSFEGWARRGRLWTITQTPDELSIVCDEAFSPPAHAQMRAEGGWHLLRVEGKLDFGLTGILSSLTAPLAKAGISIFALSTFDTDYLLVKADKLDDALQALAQAGHSCTAEKAQISLYDARNAQAMQSMILNIQQNEFGVPIRLEDQPDIMDVDAYYRRGVGNFWVAKVGDAVVGTIGFLDPGDDFLVLRKMFVRQDYRGKVWRVAEQLLQTALAYARHVNRRSILLGTIDTMHAAHRFYEKAGFKAVDKESLPATFPLMAVDNKFYRLSL